MSEEQAMPMTSGQLLDWMGMDSERWTHTFLNVTDLGNAGPDFVATVQSWFANALERGRSEGWTSQRQGLLDLNEMASRSNATSHEKGWWESGREFDGVIALIHSEASEALEEWRNNHGPSLRYYTVAKYRPEPGNLEDGVIRDVARHLDRRGDGGMVAMSELDEDVAEALVHAGFLKPEGIPAELADIIIRVGDAAEQYGIDLNQEVILKMAYNSTRPFKHGGKRS